LTSNTEGSAINSPPVDGELYVGESACVLRFERQFAHSIDRVWAALTRPEELRCWLGDADVELVEGGQFVIRWRNTPTAMHATITRLEPPRLLETSGDRFGVLRWELRQLGSGTVLRFSSTLELPAGERANNLAGWHCHLDALAVALDGGELEFVTSPRAYWQRIHEQYLVRDAASAAAFAESHRAESGGHHR
jgi:uncharacterized protein YndB with AHSA1/START domain